MPVTDEERAERARNGSRRKRDLACLPADELAELLADDGAERSPEITRAAESRERFFRWVRWAERHVPEQDAHLAASAAQMLDHLGHAVTADAVRARLRAQGRAK